MFLICRAIKGSLCPLCLQLSAREAGSPQWVALHPSSGMSLPLSGATDPLQSIPTGEQPQSLINTLNLNMREERSHSPVSPTQGNCERFAQIHKRPHSLVQPGLGAAMPGFAFLSATLLLHGPPALFLSLQPDLTGSSPLPPKTINS